MRPRGVHRLASVDGPPEHREYHVGAPFWRAEIHKTALVNEFCTVNGGMYAPTRIGPRTFLMARTHIGHDAQIGADCELGAGTVICGGVVIGDNVKIGGNTWIKPDITVGAGARIGGGSVVVKDIPAGEVWAGNPAKPLTKGREAKARGQITTAPQSGR